MNNFVTATIKTLKNMMGKKMPSKPGDSSTDLERHAEVISENYLIDYEAMQAELLKRYDPEGDKKMLPMQKKIIHPTIFKRLSEKRWIVFYL